MSRGLGDVYKRQEKNAIVAAIGFEDAMNNKKEIFGDRYVGMFDKKLEEKKNEN